MKFQILGQVPSKKNSRNIFLMRGRLMNLPSDIYKRWHKDALKQITGGIIQAAQALKPPYEVTYTLYLKDKRRRDLGNMSASVSDLLVDAKIIEDDNYTIVAKEACIFGGVDKNNPRVEVEIVSI